MIRGLELRKPPGRGGLGAGVAAVLVAAAYSSG